MNFEDLLVIGTRCFKLPTQALNLQQGLLTTCLVLIEKNEILKLTIGRELHIGNGFGMVANNITFGVFFHVPLHNVSVFVSGDEFFIIFCPNQ